MSAHHLTHTYASYRRSRSIILFGRPGIDGLSSSRGGEDAQGKGDFASLAFIVAVGIGLFVSANLNQHSLHVMSMDSPCQGFVPTRESSTESVTSEVKHRSLLSFITARPDNSTSISPLQVKPIAAGFNCRARRAASFALSSSKCRMASSLAAISF